MFPTGCREEECIIGCLACMSIATANSGSPTKHQTFVVKGMSSNQSNVADGGYITLDPGTLTEKALEDQGKRNCIQPNTNNRQWKKQGNIKNNEIKKPKIIWNQLKKSFKPKS
ncbi:hypothetical protein J6590_067769 [Homalodisca vitripennis]|nr:hypothetical protein J6590_067769 [Homalodisca vitripennis]